MFDTINKEIIRDTVYVPYEKSVSITQHNAPTADFVKLYKELKDEACSSLLHIEKFDNIVKGQFVVLQSPMSSTNDVEVYLRFHINNKEYNIQKVYKDVKYNSDLLNLIKNSTDVIVLQLCLTKGIIQEVAKSLKEEYKEKMLNQIEDKIIKEYQTTN